MMNKRAMKEMARKLGADLFGVAPVNRFDEAPGGFHPVDIYKECQSVIVLAKRVPQGVLHAETCVPYTHWNQLVTTCLDNLAMSLSLKLQDNGIGSVPVPSDDPSEYWEPDTQYARGILSLRHAGYLAGLGTIGKNTLLTNSKYGNMIRLGGLLTDVKFDGDPVVTEPQCPSACRICIDACPPSALDGRSVNQKLCREWAYITTKRGFKLMQCNLCRKKCPNALGIKNELNFTLNQRKK